jgi:hypothetical protein
LDLVNIGLVFRPAIISGWGTLSSGGAQPNILQKAFVRWEFTVGNWELVRPEFISQSASGDSSESRVRHVGLLTEWDP